MINKLVQYYFHYFLTLKIRLLFIFFWVACLFGFILLSHVSKFFVPDRSLSIYMWADKIDESMLSAFEQETGIKIYVNYYESNEELVTKFEIAKNLNCDIILPSEYIIQPLVAAGALKKIDKSKCDFMHRMYPEFLGQSFDPKNEYSLPIYWDVLGLGYTKSFFPHGLPCNSWSLIFNKNLLPCRYISMVDDSREAIFLSMKYLGWDRKSLNMQQIEQIKNLFVIQKSWVGAYTDFQQGYFLTSKTYPLVVSQRERIVREMLVNDDIEFTIPDEGSLMILSNIAICSTSAKDDLVYQFLNYIYSKSVLDYNCKKFSILPVVKDVLEELPEEYIGVEELLPGQKNFKKLEFFSNILTQKQINDIWIAFKSF